MTVSVRASRIAHIAPHFLGTRAGFLPWLFCCLVLAPGLPLPSSLAGGPIGRYNVVWDSPSKDASGQMPLGNGDIAAGVYAIEDGDLYLLLAKNDAFNYNGDIYKTGRVRISLSPNPFPYLS